MFRRRSAVSYRGPGLASTVARTAVIAGTATATSNAVASRQQRRHQADTSNLAQLQLDRANLQAEQVSADMTPAGGQGLITQLTQLGELKENGILTDEEFNKAKAKILGG